MIDWPARFAEVVRRRTREALAAELPPFEKVEIGAMKHDLERRPWVQTIAMAPSGDLPSAFRMLRSMGVVRMSAIGGRTIARAMIDAGVVQDLYLTTSPRPGGEPDTPLYPTRLDAKLVVRKRGTGPEAGVVFEHLLLKPTI